MDFRKIPPILNLTKIPPVEPALVLYVLMEKHDNANGVTGFMRRQSKIPPTI